MAVKLYTIIITILLYWYNNPPRVTLYLNWTPSVLRHVRNNSFQLCINFTVYTVHCGIKSIAGSVQGDTFLQPYKGYTCIHAKAHTLKPFRDSAFEPSMFF